LNLKEIIEKTIIDVIVEEIVGEVLERLKKLPKKALVIFTGGTIGFHESIEQLKKLQKDGWKFKVLLSKGAENIYTKELIKNLLGLEDTEIDGEMDAKETKNYYKDIDKVILPVLTMNTAAKVSLGIADNLVTNIIARSLMTNIPIVASKNACDPLEEERIRIGLGKGSTSYVNMMKNHLNRLESYGIKLTHGNKLYEVAVENTKQGIHKKDHPVKKQVVYDKKVLTRGDVVSAFHIKKDLILRSNTIITEVAKDTAKELGVKIIVEKR
jgi:hypothetical protein